MFNLELLISADDLQNEKRMARHRASLDGGAKSHRSRAEFQREEIEPYIVRIVRDGQTVSLPETDETRQYKVLRRFYE